MRLQKATIEFEWWVRGLHSHFCVQPNHSFEVVLWLCCVVVGVVTISLMYKPDIVLAKIETTLEPTACAKGELEEGEPSKKSIKDNLGNFIDKIPKDRLKIKNDKKAPFLASS